MKKLENIVNVIQKILKDKIQIFEYKKKIIELLLVLN